MSRRSDYFSTMLGSSFQEGSAASCGDMLEIQVADVEPGVLYAALRWVYTDRVDADMPAQQLLQVGSPLTPSTISTQLNSGNQTCQFICNDVSVSAIATLSIISSSHGQPQIKVVHLVP